MKPIIRLPFEGKYPISQKFGTAYPWYVKIAGYPHNGIDYAIPKGIPILACDDGLVTYADNVADSDGMGVNLQHRWGLSQYWHLSKLVAIFNKTVKKGNLIGYSGASGWVTGPHLHFGIKVHGAGAPGMRGWTNPKSYFESAYQEPVPAMPVDRFYRVKWGDSLWKIAEKFYGNGGHWSTIYKANKDKIKNPSVIYPFQRLRIP